MNSSGTHVPSLLGALLFLMAAVIYVVVSIVMAATALGTFLSGGEVMAQHTIVLGVAVFQALILLAATYALGQKFLNRPSAEVESGFPVSLRVILVSLVIAGIVILLGSQVNANRSINWLLLPVLTIPAVALPILVMLILGVKQIPLGPRWQTWSVFGLSMTLAPFILVILELIAMLVLVSIVGLFFFSQPGFTSEMEQFISQFSQMNPNSEAAQQFLAPYLNHPAVFGIALTYFALIVPLLEEIFKPLGVWLFAGKLNTPAQGFALGAISGAAYALIETLGVSAQTADWASLLLARIGTGVLHVTTSALMGAAIVAGIRERRYLRLFGTYLLAVALHGFWNALAIFYTFATLAQELDLQSPLSGAQMPVNISMGVLGVILLIVLVASNRRMRATLPPQPVAETPT